MRVLWLGCCAAMIGASTASAQSPAPALPVRIQPPGVSQLTAGEVRLSATYSLTTNLSEAPDAGGLLTAQAKLHRALYEAVAQECKLLLETIAAQCRLEGSNVSSNVQRNPQPQGNPALWLNSNAFMTFRINLKD